MKTYIGIIIVVLVLLTCGVGYWFLTVDKKLNESNMSDTFTQTKDSTVDQNQGDINTNDPSTVEEGSIINKEENQKVMTATLKTSKGDITIEFNSATPKTVENFVKLAKAGFYDGTKFHRVIKGFMSQGGDPLSKDDSEASAWGTGGPGYKFEDEITSSNRNDTYTISMANAGPNTNGSQFFINAANNNFLDTKHTVFGKVIKGQEVADAINNVKTGPSDRPVEAVVILKVTLE